MICTLFLLLAKRPIETPPITRRKGRAILSGDHQRKGKLGAKPRRKGWTRGTEISVSRGPRGRKAPAMNSSKGTASVEVQRGLSSKGDASSFLSRAHAGRFPLSSTEEDLG